MPETCKVWDYIVEEVSRQGFDVNTDRGMARVEWMSGAWAWAECQSRRRRYPTADDIVEIGRLVERIQNAAGIRSCGVRVGSHIAPPWTDVRRLLEELTREAPQLKSLTFYERLLKIHPFIDGNGRAGKVALAWHAQSLAAPFFPPNDFWGSWIRNP